MSQTNKQKQTTKVIVKIGSDVIKQKRRRVKRQKKTVERPEPQPQPQIRQSFGTLLPQNTSFNSNIQSSLENVLKQQADLNALFNKLQSSSQSSFTSNIKNPLENILKTESNLNKTVDKLRADQRPEENEGQNAQLVSGLNLNNDDPIDYQALLNLLNEERPVLEDRGTQTGLEEEEKNPLPESQEVEEEEEEQKIDKPPGGIDPLTIQEFENDTGLRGKSKSLILDLLRDLNGQKIKLARMDKINRENLILFIFKNQKAINFDPFLMTTGKFNKK